MISRVLTKITLLLFCIPGIAYGSDSSSSKGKEPNTVDTSKLGWRIEAAQPVTDYSYRAKPQTGANCGYHAVLRRQSVKAFRMSSHSFG